MYRVIIAEDEMFVRLGIKMSVDWEKIGMEVIADVANGKAAFDIYEREHPDIILTDIKMPIMDGMELIRKIRKEDKQTRIIILSCLEEFNLVREAISMDVTDYILKLTMTQEDMEKVLDKAKIELELLQEKGKSETGLSIGETHRKLLESFYYQGYGAESIRDRIVKLALPIGEKNLMMAALEIHEYKKIKKRFKDEYGTIISATLNNVLTELMTKYGKGFVIEEKEARYILIAEHGETRQKSVAEFYFLEFLTNLQKTLLIYFQLEAAIGISQLFDGYGNLPEMYQQCNDCLQQKFYYERGARLQYYQVKKNNKAELVISEMEKLKEKEEIGPKIKKMIESGIEIFLETQNQQDIISFFVHMTDVEVNDAAINHQRRFAMIGKYVNQMQQAESMQSLVELFESCTKNLYEKQETGSVISKTVADVIQYISQNYSINLSLEQIADFVELSPNYVCGLFKKEMGINLSNYIMEYRISRAKELLVSTNMRAYEIAEKTGFADESYFSRSFKKVTGQAPGNFKRTVYTKEEG